MTRYLTITFVLFNTGCTHVTDEPHDMRIDTPDGEVVAHHTNVEETPQTITLIHGDELAWLESLDDDGPQFVSHYIPDVTEPGLKDYDAAFRAWQLDDSPPYSDDKVIELIGGYLGNKCVADLGMEWVLVSDGYGTNYAVRSATVEVMSFPFVSVLKRIEDMEFDFIHGVYYTIKEMLSNGEYKKR